MHVNCQNAPTYYQSIRALLVGFAGLYKNALLHGNVFHCEELRFGPLSCAELLSTDLSIIKVYTCSTSFASRACKLDTVNISAT